MITKYKLKKQTAKANYYNKKLYIRSKNDIPYAQTLIENSLHNFMELIGSINKKSQNNRNMISTNTKEQPCNT